MLIQCIECQVKFEFSESEEAFFKSKNLVSPKRCPKCRALRKAQQGGAKPWQR